MTWIVDVSLTLIICGIGVSVQKGVQALYYRLVKSLVRKG